MALVSLSPRQRSELEYLASHNLVAKEWCRAQALLWLDEGEAAEQIPPLSALAAGRSITGWIGSMTAMGST